MTVVVNGERKEVPPRASVADAIAGLVPEARRGVAVAVNGEVVPRSEWPTTPVHEEDRIEVLNAIGGG